MLEKASNKTLRLAFILVFIIVGFLVWSTYSNMSKALLEGQRIRSALDVLLRLENMLVHVKSVESAQRGYALSGKDIFLHGYRQGLSNIRNDTAFFNTSGVIREEEAQKLSQLILNKTRNAELVIELRDKYGDDSARSYSSKGIGIQLMNDLNFYVSGLGTKVRSYLETANKNREIYTQRTALRFFLMALLFPAILFLNYRRIIKDLRKLKRGEQKLQFNASLIKNISDPIITTDKDLNITNWNSFAADLYGYREQDVLGKKLSTILKTQAISIVDEDRMEVFNNRGHWRGELIHFHQNGDPITVEATSSAVYNEDGEKTGTVSVIRDIRQRKRIEGQVLQLTNHLEEEVKAKVSELNNVFERITDAFIALDNSWRYTYLNKKAEDLHNKKAEELLGKLIWDEFPDLVDQPFCNALKKAKEAQQSMRVELYYPTTDRWYEDLIYPSADGISVYYHDITNRKTAELELERNIEKLKVSEEDLKISIERFELVAKATNDAVWDWDIKSNTIWGNDNLRSIFKASSQAVISFEDFTGRIHPEDRQGVLANFETALKNKSNFLTEEFSFRINDGTYRNIYDRAYILYDAANKPYRMLGAMQDITDQKIIQQRLQVEMAMSDSIINSLPGVFYLSNRERFYRWNHNLEQVTGYTHEEIKNMVPMDLFPDNEKEIIRNKITSVYKTGADSVEAKFLLKNGRTVPYYFTAMRIQYEGEALVMGVGIDISERISSQTKLKESEEKYRTLIEQASDGFFISNEYGGLVDVNTSATTLTGYSRNELLSKRIQDIFYRDELAKVPLLIDELMKGNVILEECSVTKKSGQVIDVEISSKRLPDGRYQAIARDITSRKRAEELVKSSELKYRLLFNQNPLPMWMISSIDRKFLDVNTAAIAFYGYSKEEFLRMTIMDIRPPEESERLLKTEFNKTGISDAGIWTHRKKNGTLINVNIITHDILYEGNHAKLVLANDVTDRLIAEDKLKKSHEEFRQLASHLENIRESERTHIAREIHDELGQQLTGLKMDISWIRKRLKTEDNEVVKKLNDTIQLVDTTVKTVRRIATELRPSILDDLGIIAAMEWHTEEFEKRFKIPSTFRSNVQNINISSDFSTALFRIYQESLTNVVRHANATNVTSSLNVQGNKLVLNISDNGKGFNSNEIKNKKTLGLLGMKERTLLMGGTYEISSRDGKGTSVIIIVPLKEQIQ